MTFIMKKKKYKFNVIITVEQLGSVPFVNAMLFVKCRLRDGGNFIDHTDRREVEDHCVKWNKTFNFQAKMSANASTGLLDDCPLRLSIRKETKGGKAYLKLGYVDLNLASFPGHGLTECRCLLEGYERDRNHRQDNSMLHLKVDMKLLAGDPCFITPKFNCLTQHSKQGSSEILADASDTLLLPPPNKLFDDGVIDTTQQLLQQPRVGTPGTPTGNAICMGLVSSSDDEDMLHHHIQNHEHYHHTNKSQTLSHHLPYHHHQKNVSHSNTPVFEKKSQTLTYNNINNFVINNNNNSNNNNNDNNSNGGTTHMCSSDVTSSCTSSNANGSNSVSGCGASAAGIGNFDVFESMLPSQSLVNHSRSNSSQTNSSRISATTGFNSLPTHSRQGSNDSGQNANNSSNLRFSNEIKFNSVDRVGNKHRHHHHQYPTYERLKPNTVVLNGLGVDSLHQDSTTACTVAASTYQTGPQNSKQAIDSTRVSATEFVEEFLLQKNIDETMSVGNNEMFSNDGGDLDILVGADGSASVISRRHKTSSTTSSSNKKSSNSCSNGRSSKSSNKAATTTATEKS